MEMPRIRSDAEDVNGKPWIAIDVDGTLADIHTVLINIINATSERKFTVNDITNWSFEKTGLPINDKQFLELHRLMWTTKWRDIMPLVSEGLLLELSKYYNIAIVTNRPEETVGPLVEWLGANFPNITYKLVANIVAHDKSEQSFSIYIDDSPSLAKKLALRNGGKVQYMRDAPWNRDAPQSPSLIRVPDTETAVRKLIQEGKVGAARQISRSTG
jgi:5'(3')-deoxyribonucleotidase